MTAPSFDFKSRWARAASLMERSGIEQVESGMVLAIGNCGIYRESFGVRMEDTVWVSEQGPVSLTRHPKTLNA